MSAQPTDRANEEERVQVGSAFGSPCRAPPHGSSLSFGRMKGLLQSCASQLGHQPTAWKLPGFVSATPWITPILVPHHSQTGPEPGAAHNEGRAGVWGDWDGFFAALMCELVRWAAKDAK
jgi:hypothetical protein